MALSLRVLLIVGSVATSIYFLVQIRRSKIRIEDAIFWLLFSLGIIVLSIFPVILDYFAGLLGVLSPVNFLYLVVLFLLLVRVFRLTLRVSMLDCKLNQLGQNEALKAADRQLSEKEGGEGHHE